MSLTPMIQEALANAGLTADEFILSVPGANGGVNVTSPTNDYDHVVFMRNALEKYLPNDYMVALGRLRTYPSVYVSTWPAES